MLIRGALSSECQHNLKNKFLSQVFSLPRGERSARSFVTHPESHAVATSVETPSSHYSLACRGPSPKPTPPPMRPPQPPPRCAIPSPGCGLSVMRRNLRCLLPRGCPLGGMARKDRAFRRAAANALPLPSGPMSPPTS